MLARILLVDDERDFLESLERGLVISGFQHILATHDPREAIALIGAGEPIDVAILDLTMPEINGLEVLAAIKQLSPSTECIMVTAVDEARLAVQCMQQGAFDYRIKPVNLEDLLEIILKALERKNLLEIQRISKQSSHPALDHPEAFAEITTRSPRMLRILREAELHAASKVPILITGETGTGKELLARAIHRASGRADRMYLPVNMSSFSSTLFEADFYGHTKGAFTGADQERRGLLEQAGHGTLFLDEIGSMPLDLQGKLLRVLQEGEFFKLGSSGPKGVDVRFIAATNADLQILQEQGHFRKDLFYRLCGAWLALPPLRERKEDIPLLVNDLLEAYGVEPGQRAFDPLAWQILQAYDYPGNIRELKSIIQHAANLAQGAPLARHHLPAYMTATMATQASALVLEPEKPIRPLAEVEQEHILRAYQSTKGNKQQTARLLAIGLNTLRRKLQAYGVD
jgi:two-component system response regulator AtoC